MPHPAALALVPAFQALFQLVSEHHEREHERATAELQSSALRHLADAFVTRRVAVVERGFHAILEPYALDARNLHREKEELLALMREATGARDAIGMTAYASRSNEIDTRLAEIRADARLLYQHMCECLIAIGGRGVECLADLAPTLNLPPPRR
jgi:hypothetical protein